MIPNVIPDGSAEFYVIIITSLFLVYLWWQKEFGNKPTNCAMADIKVKEIVAKMEKLADARQKLEQELVDIHKRSEETQKLLFEVIQENTVANTILAERLK